MWKLWPTLHVILEKHIDSQVIKGIREGPENIYTGILFPYRISREEAIADHLRLLNRYLNRVREQLDGLDPKDVLIYQEGVSVEFPEPATEAYSEIIEKLISESAEEFPNSSFTQIAIPLICKGATLIGTESSELMEKSGEAPGQINSPSTPPHIRNRDAFIRRRVTKTLPRNKVGILIIGGAHFTGRHVSWKVNIQTHRDLYDEYSASVKNNFGIY